MTTVAGLYQMMFTVILSLWLYGEGRRREVSGCNTEIWFAKTKNS